MNQERSASMAAAIRGGDDLAAFARQETWDIDGVTVSKDDVCHWMASVGHKVADSRYWYYVKWYDVPRKIARAKSTGEFARIVAQACMTAGLVEGVKLEVLAPSKATGKGQDGARNEPLAALIRVVMRERRPDTASFEGGLQ